jgi:AMP nucleosidase
VPVDEISLFETVPTPEEAVGRLIALYDRAIEAQRDALERFFSTRVAPTAEERAQFRYPELRVIYRAKT